MASAFCPNSSSSVWGGWRPHYTGPAGRHDDQSNHPPGETESRPRENSSARAQAAEGRAPQGRGEARRVKRDSLGKCRPFLNRLHGRCRLRQGRGRHSQALRLLVARADPHPRSPAVLWKGPRAAEHTSRPGCSPDAPEVPPSVPAQRPGFPMGHRRCGCFCLGSV